MTTSATIVLDTNILSLPTGRKFIEEDLRGREYNGIVKIERVCVEINTILSELQSKSVLFHLKEKMQKKIDSGEWEAHEVEWFKLIERQLGPADSKIIQLGMNLTKKYGLVIILTNDYNFRKYVNNMNQRARCRKAPIYAAANFADIINSRQNSVLIQKIERLVGNKN